MSENYPSAVAALEAGSYVAAVVGAGVTSGCNPADANYEQFFNAMAAGSWKETIEKASHVSFISPLIGLGDLSLGNLMTRVASIACGKARISNTVRGWVGSSGSVGLASFPQCSGMHAPAFARLAPPRARQAALGSPYMQLLAHQSSAAQAAWLSIASCCSS